MVAPANDDVADALPIDLSTGTYTSALIDTSGAMDATVPAAWSADHWVWWKLTPTVNNALDIDTNLSSAGADTMLGMWKGPADPSTIQSANLITSNDDDPDSGNLTSRITSIPVYAGNTYIFGVGGWNTPRTYELRVVGTADAGTATGGGGGVTPVGTAATYDNDGYDYDGSAVVDDDPPVDLPPVHAREDIDRVHQSLPAPTLVDGRPT